MSRRPADLAAALLALATLAFAAGAPARTSDRNQPMDIEAAQSTCSLGANDSCTLTGNVTMTQGSLRVVAAKAVIEQSGGDPSRALLSGGVTLRQTLDDGNQIDATASNVDYNLRTGQLESGGGTGGGRVKMRILPKSAQAQPAPAKASN